MKYLTTSYFLKKISLFLRNTQCVNQVKLIELLINKSIPDCGHCSKSNAVMGFMRIHTPYPQTVNIYVMKVNLSKIISLPA